MTTNETEPTDVIAAGPADVLPGLEPAKQQASSLEVAVRRTLAQLGRDGHLTEVTAGHTALAVELSVIIAEKRNRGRTSTVANDARLLVELLDGLRPDASVDAEVADALREAVELWKAEAGL